MAHGTTISNAIAPKSKSYQGPFGRICGNLPAWIGPRGDDCMPMNEPQIDAVFREFARLHMVERLDNNDRIIPPEDLLTDEAVTDLERDFGSTTIPAGYTYFGQFVDHDITFDPASSLMRDNDPESLLNFRTPRLDLDNLYGRGPADQPYMFEITHDDPDEKARRERLGAWKFKIGKVRRRRVDGDVEIESRFEDLPRAACGTAIIGDKRNDENAIVSQMQLAFLKAHNTLVERALAQGSCTPFEDAKRALRWLYQWIVWNDFLARIADPDIRALALHMDPGGHPGGPKFELGLKHVYNWKHQPFMPVEFAVAAYRFGHSMVRNGYRTNLLRGFAIGDQAPLFDTTEGGDDDLRGFRWMREENLVQWDWFLPMTSSGGDFPQMARKIDTSLSNALANLAETPNFLAYRNLKRGWTFNLPSGTDVARKFTCDSVIDLDPGEPDSLWFYILKEAGLGGGEHLGRLGSTIVCAVFAGLLKGDPASWVNVHPCWHPSRDPLLIAGEDNIDSGGGDDWQLGAIMRIAGVPIAGGDFA